MAKQYFDSRGVAYEEIDVEKDPAEGQKIVEETGQMGVPVIRIGSELIVGFNRPKIDEALAKIAKM